MYALEDISIRGDLIKWFKFIKQVDIEGLDFKRRAQNF